MLHAGLKKCHFGNFSDWALGSYEFLAICWKAKLERAYSYRVQSGKITVCFPYSETWGRNMGQEIRHFIVFQILAKGNFTMKRQNKNTLSKRISTSSLCALDLQQLSFEL